MYKYALLKEKSTFRVKFELEWQAFALMIVSHSKSSFYPILVIIQI